MKKVFLAILVGLVFLSLSFTLVLAKSGKVNLEGEIIAVDEVGQTITIRTTEGEEYTIYFSPEDAFNYTFEDLGSFVHVKGELQEDGTILAEWVKLELDEDEGDEGGKAESAYCSGEKETPHPVAIVLANRFDKDVEDIMGYFCDGFGIGQIYLALKTELITGVDYGELLGSRTEGKGWGEIWKELGYKSKSKDDAKTPPGQDKDKDKGPDDDPDAKEKKDKDSEDVDVKEKKPKKPKKEKDK